MKFLKTSFIAFLLLIFFCGNNKAFSQTPSRFSFEKYVEGKDTLFYRQLYPDFDTLRKYPLVIFLHGSGERGNDNEAQLKWGVKNFATDEMMKLHPAIVIAPQCPEKKGWSNFSRTNSTEMTLLPAPSRQMEMLITLIH